MTKNKAQIDTGPNRKHALGSFPFLSVLAFVLLTFPQCKQPYNSPYKSPATGYLVVEGYISGSSPTSFTLSRTIKLSQDTTNPQEPGASVQIEGSDNSSYPLTEQGGGVYTSAGVLPLTASTNYRVRIRTASGGEYQSDFTPYKLTPAIDSINWIEDDNGVSIYANAHDDAGTTRYYQWNYDETWQYTSSEFSSYEFHAPDSFIYRPPQDQIYNCWHSYSSTTLFIQSTTKLSKDVVYEQPLRQIPANTEPLGVLYSILVRQYALTEDAYNYLSLLKTNTESLGTIFDPQPSDLSGGNIHSLINANEPVIGFVCAGIVQQQRIFISRSQLSDWVFAPVACPVRDTVFPNTPANLKDFFASYYYIPVSFDVNDLYYSNFAGCVDCTRQGGTTIKPSFWPN